MLKTSWNSGFFSCCNVKLYKLVYYFNTHKALPTHTDDSELFDMYNLPRMPARTLHIIFSDPETMCASTSRGLFKSWTNESKTNSHPIRVSTSVLSSPFSKNTILLLNQFSTSKPPSSPNTG